MAMMAIGPNFDWGAYQRNGNSMTPQPGSQAWQQNMQQQIQQQLSAIPQPQMPQFQPMPAFQAATQQIGEGLWGNRQPPPGSGATQAAQGGGAAASPVAGEDPRLTAILAQLKDQAALNDSVISDQASQGIAAQRAVMQRQLEKQLTGTLSSRGLLAGGGNVAKLRQELEAPMQEQLAAQQERIRQDLVGRRDATSNNLAGQLTDLQRQKAAGESDRARLALEQQRAAQDAAARQQQFAFDQQKFQWDAQNTAQRNAYDQAMQQYQLQQDALRTSLLQQQQNMARNSGYNDSAGSGYNASAAASRPSGGAGGGSLAGTGYNDTSWFDLNPGSTAGIGASRDAAHQQRLAVERASQQNARPSGASVAPAWQSVNSGNGMSSAGSTTGVGFAGSPTGFSSYAPTGQGYAGTPTGISWGGSNFNSAMVGGYPNQVGWG